jgi:sec-independent protein translocase protein TatC
MAQTRAEAKMPLTEHLSELRRRLFICLGGIGVGFAVAFAFSERLFQALTLPLRAYPVLSTQAPFLSFAQRPQAPDLVFLAPAEAFWMHIKVAMIAGLMAAVPLLLQQAWRFVSPGLLESEKRYVGPFVAVGTGLFFLGAAFCFLVVLPFAMQFLLNYKTESFVPMLSVGRYVDFCLKFILAFGLVFELPVLIVLLSRMGLVSPHTLARHRKYAVLLAFVVAALLTPTPDAFNQTLMAVPIVLLYEAGVQAAKLFAPRRGRK